jgi:hypothetical protein
MTDTTTQQTTAGTAPAPEPIAPPNFSSVSAKARELLLEIDNSQVHTEVSQFLIAGRAQVVATLSYIEAHFHAFEQKAAVATKVVESTVAQSTSTATPATPAATPAAQ